MKNRMRCVMAFLITVAILCCTGLMPVIPAVAEEPRVYADRSTVHIGIPESVTVTVTGGLKANTWHRVRLYRAKEGYDVSDTAFGSFGVYFIDANLIGDANGITTNASGGGSVTETLHNQITTPGIYAYCIMENWDTKAVVFIEVAQPDPEAALPKITANRTVVSLGAEEPIEISIVNGTKAGLIAGKYYHVRLYRAKADYDAVDNGFGNSGVNYGAGKLGNDGNGITLNVNGAGSTVQTVHTGAITTAGTYAYTIMDDDWDTKARIFFTVIRPIKGDVNGDEVWDIKDLVRLKKIIAGLSPVTYGADVTGDEDVNAADLAKMVERLLFGYVSPYEDNAEALRNAVLHAADTVSATGNGRTFYISPSGSDNNNGTSTSTPWRTLEHLNSVSSGFRTGDAVLLERGATFRPTRQIELVSGVSYGAYGTGSKPRVFGSKKNYAASAWQQVGTNLWKLNEDVGTNVGLIVFDFGKAVGWWKNSRAELQKDYDYCTNEGYVLLYLNGDPTQRCDDIEIGRNGYLFSMGSGSHDITIENICFRYGGGHAVRGADCTNVTVRNLEIGYVGGCILSGFGDGTTRYGNGVEFMSNSQNVLVEHNWIYQIYDSGVTHQGRGDYHLNGFTVRNNLIEYCGMGSIEYWHSVENDIANVTYEGNLLRYAGYGFGGAQRPDKHMTAHIMSNGTTENSLWNQASNFVIRNNLFELSTYYLVNATSGAGTPPVLSGNTYVQWRGRMLGIYRFVNLRMFDENVAKTVAEKLGDTTATVVYAGE